MKKEIIKVPGHVGYLSEWKDFSLPDHPCIINKTLTGCGFTEWCITSNLPIILCSPRRVLLTNKENQHSGEVYYARNEYENVIGVDIDLTNTKKPTPTEMLIEKSQESVKLFENKVIDAILNFSMRGKVPKILVTYDSFRLLYEVLTKHNYLNYFYIVVDEFQSIFTDSRFKASTEMEFVNYLRGLQKVCLVSATPMMEEYLDLLEDFKKLPYYELDWKSENPGRIDIPNIIPNPYRGSLVSIAINIIDDYKSGRFEKDIIRDDQGNLIETESKEVVFFVNSVRNICDIIKKCGLTVDNTDVICSDTEYNKEKVRLAFGIRGKANFTRENLTHIPKFGEPRKMFTLCTKTAYLGADFYSDNARTIILSDANIECLAVDITLDLPQILGRQRNFKNPWKNCAELYFKTGTGIHDITEEDFNNLIKEKLISTDTLLNLFERAVDREKQEYIKILEDSISINHYRNNYVSIDMHSGSSKVPRKNDLVLVSERRAFDIQRKDYFNRFSVLSEIEKRFGSISKSPDSIDILDEFVKIFSKLQRFTDKMKYICDSVKSYPTLENRILKLVPKEMKNLYLVVGVKRLSALSYQKSKILSEIGQSDQVTSVSDNLRDLIYSEFSEGDKVPRSVLKDRLTYIYELSGIDKKVQASAIEEFFEVERVKISNRQTGKRDEGFKLLRKRV